LPLIFDSLILPYAMFQVNNTACSKAKFFTFFFFSTILNSLFLKNLSRYVQCTYNLFTFVENHY